MSIAKVQSRHATSGTAATSRALAYTSNVSAANLLVAVVYFESATATISSVVSTLSGAMTAIGSLTRSGNNTCAQIFYLKNCTGGADTITATLSASVINGLAIFEYSSADLTSPLRGHAEASGGTANPSSGNLDVAPTANDLLFGVCVDNTSPSAGSGYTIQENNFGWNDTCQAEDKLAVSETAVVWVNGTSTWAALGAAFKPAATTITKGATAKGNNPTSATNIDATITGSPTNGSTWILGVVSRNASSLVNAISDDSTGGPMVFTQIADYVHGATQIHTSLWRTAVGGGKPSATKFTITLSVVERDTVIVAEEFLGVAAFGLDVTTNGTNADPTNSLTTQDDNNEVLAIFGARGGTAPTAKTGQLDVVQTSEGGSQVSGALVANTAATPQSVTCAETLAAATWTSIIEELRTAAPGGGAGQRTLLLLGVGS